MALAEVWDDAGNGYTTSKTNGVQQMLKNTVRGILGLVLTAAATWLANYIVDQMFGPDEEAA
jgi:hypothetical protein